MKVSSWRKADVQCQSPTFHGHGYAHHQPKTVAQPWPLALLDCVAGRAARKTPADCPKCAEWNESQKPFKVYGNTYYVGIHGLDLHPDHVTAMVTS